MLFQCMVCRLILILAYIAWQHTIMDSLLDLTNDCLLVKNIWYWLYNCRRHRWHALACRGRNAVGHQWWDTAGWCGRDAAGREEEAPQIADGYVVRVINNDPNIVIFEDFDLVGMFDQEHQEVVLIRDEEVVEVVSRNNRQTCLLTKRCSKSLTKECFGSSTN